MAVSKIEARLYRRASIYRLRSAGLPGWTNFNLHEAVLCADALDDDLCSSVGVHHAALRVGRIIVRVPVVEHPDRGKARNRAKDTGLMNVGDPVGTIQGEG